ncbi:MAG: hypothetical protein KJ698_00795 [Actinobacteria bacterium]|nr:hypothetical protein [Actinomycetota bacterium]MBU1494984.1 hypothetical protein [Actinomycetota bacterium]MBU1865891.1 hypothetical protein [Actinomycetota bacterium]
MGRAKKLALWLGGGAAVFVAIVAVGVLVLFRDSATPLSGEDKAGLYVYQTTGFETASALGGGRHDYPAETYLSVVVEDCGTAYRWQALEERWDETLLCEDGRLDRTTSWHKWFGVEDLSHYICDASAHVVPIGDETTWAFQCENAGVTTVHWVYEVVGIETVEIGGEEVEATHIVATETDSGTTVGTGTHHRWVLTNPYLVVKERVDIANTTESPIGGVDYVEQYEIVLTSLAPSE